MGLVKAKSGFYYVRFKQGNETVKFSLRTKSQRMAEDLYYAYLQEHLKNNIWKKSTGIIQDNQYYKEPILSKSVEKKIPKTDIATIYPEYIRSCEVKDFSKYTLRIKHYFQKNIELFKIKFPEDFNQAMINRFFDYWTKNYKVNSIAKFSGELRAFLHWLIKKRLYKQDDYSCLDIPKYKVKAKEMVIKAEDLEKISTYTKENDYD